MNTWRKISRRALLRLGAEATALAWLAPALLDATGCARPGRAPREVGNLALGVPASAQRLGEAYRAMRPRENDAVLLQRALGLDEAALTALAEDPHSPVRRRLAQLQREDFREGRLVTVAGWMLSETELRLAALVSILTDPS